VNAEEIHHHPVPPQMKEGMEVGGEFRIIEQNVITGLPRESGSHDVQRIGCVHLECKPFGCFRIDHPLHRLPPRRYHRDVYFVRINAAGHAVAKMG